MSDSGRVQDIIQGRHLITPDELISLDKEVIVFTADTKPLKLPLTEPTAYEQALSYEPPSRATHQVSEFVKKRGCIDRSQSEDRGQETRDAEQEPEAKPVALPEAEAGFARQQMSAKPELEDREETQRKRYPHRSDGAPDYDL